MNNSKEARTSHANPIALVLMIPIGTLLILFIVNSVSKYVYEYKINSFTKNLIVEMLDDRKITDYRQVAIDKFSEAGYDIDDLTVIYEDETLIIINHVYYKSLFNGLTNIGNSFVTVRYKAYYDDSKEVVIEEYNEDDIDDGEVVDTVVVE